MEEWETGKVVEAAELIEESCSGSELGLSWGGGCGCIPPRSQSLPSVGPNLPTQPEAAVPPSSGGSSLREAQHMCPLPILARRSGP